MRRLACSRLEKPDPRLTPEDFPVKLSQSRLPSPALVIACVALFVSLGGVSYGVATGFIDSRELKNNTIRSKDVRNNTLRTFDVRNNEIRGFDIRNSTVQGRDVAFNTLTGADVSEGTLDKVPTAGTADTATTAGSAGSVGGVSMRRFNYAGEAGSDFVEVLNFGGLRLEARCQAPSDLEVRATPANAESELASTFTAVPPLVVDGAGAGVIALVNPDGVTATVQALAVEDPNDVQGTTNDCGFSGIAEAG
jgi:hypothetical protein